jgi:hypothetical protein
VRRGGGGGGGGGGGKNMSDFPKNSGNLHKTGIKK